AAPMVRPHPASMIDDPAQSSPRKIQDSVKGAIYEGDGIAQCDARHGNRICPFRLVADDIETLLKAVVLVPKQQRILAMLKDSAMRLIVLADGRATGIQTVHGAIMNQVVKRAHAQNRAT